MAKMQTLYIFSFHINATATCSLQPDKELSNFDCHSSCNLIDKLEQNLSKKLVGVRCTFFSFIAHFFNH